MKEEVVNPTGDFKRVEQKMAQIEEFVYVERISIVNGIDFVTGKSPNGIKIVQMKNAELCNGECRELQFDMEPLRA
ncbi:hypothetical protein [Bacillus methanolicus]|uniref:hypothetical protein n=1 Tax=Bacillus methanolicus TaxID=1471 RepID=UPI00200DB6DF|nr:hypothetical protein [Bacillus methanolicus]